MGEEEVNQQHKVLPWLKTERWQLIQSTQGFSGQVAVRETEVGVKLSETILKAVAKSVLGNQVRKCC